MSKTDKTRPWWAQVTKWVPAHYCIQLGKPCDLPANPPRNAMEGNWRTQINQVCEWQPANWNEVTYPRYRDNWDREIVSRRQRERRAWRRDQGVA